MVASELMAGGVPIPYREYNYLTGSSLIISPDNDPGQNLFLLLGDALGLSPHDYHEKMEINSGSLSEDNRFDFIYNFYSNKNFEEVKPSTTEPEAPSNSAVVLLQKSHDELFGMWAWYSTGQCQSLVGGDRDFTIAVINNLELSDIEKRKLIGERKKLHVICDGSDSTEISWSKDIQSKAALEFLIYLQASGYFYDGRLTWAVEKYQTLMTSSDLWVKEVAHYMVARALLKYAHDNAFDKWGNFVASRTVQEEVAKAEDAFLKYLSMYPNGKYSASAKGLMRRVLFLRRDKRGLAKAYEEALNSKDLSIDRERLSQEMFDKTSNFIQSDLIEAPTLLAVRFLDDFMIGEGDRIYFSSQPDLFQFLLAAQEFYINDNAEFVLQRIPELKQNIELSSLQFSRQALRGMALNKLKNPKENEFWTRFLNRPLNNSQKGVIELWRSGIYKWEGFSHYYSN